MIQKIAITIAVVGLLFGGVGIVQDATVMDSEPGEDIGLSSIEGQFIDIPDLNKFSIPVEAGDCFGCSDPNQDSPQ